MKPFTQSNLDPGNCWQTAIACILGVDPETLPPQHEIEGPAAEVLRGWGSYTNVLNAYLAKHHGLIYFEVQRYQFGGVRPSRPEHILCGPTVRTEAHKAAGRQQFNHCVVARNGVAVWDVHPSRAGLIGVDSWGVLGDRQPDHDAGLSERRRREDEIYRLIWDCLCPVCGLSELRRRVAAQSAAA
jgi:hypothetical protein